MPRNLDASNLREQDLFAILSHFFGQPKSSAEEQSNSSAGTQPKLSAEETARWASKLLKRRISRNMVYPILRRAIENRFCRYHPPVEQRLEEALLNKYPRLKKERLRVVNVLPEHAQDAVAEAAADWIMDQARCQHADRQDIETPDGNFVHVGFASGGTTRSVAHTLGFRLRQEDNVPPFHFHALTSGFSVDDPTTAPVAFPGFFLVLATGFGGQASSASRSCKRETLIRKSCKTRESRERSPRRISSTFWLAR